MSFLLQTNRLVLREFVVSDAPEMFALNADPDVLKYTGDLAFKHLEETQMFIKNYTDYKRNGIGRWAVSLKTNPKMLGWCGLKKHPDGLVDLGFRFKKKHWGKGFATEAANACITYGFTTLNLTKIVGRAESENIASIAVLKKCGFHFSHKELDELHHQKQIEVYTLHHEDFCRH